LSPPQKLEVSIGYLVGDCLVAAAFLSYAGPFLSNYRDELVQQTWLKQVCTQWLCACGIVVVGTVAVSEFLTEILLTGGNLGASLMYGCIQGIVSFYGYMPLL